jgi:hypothetical protein
MVEKQISSYYRPAARWIRWVVKGGDGKRFLLAILTLPLAALLVACATGSHPSTATALWTVRPPP